LLKEEKKLPNAKDGEKTSGRRGRKNYAKDAKENQIEVTAFGFCIFRVLCEFLRPLRPVKSVFYPYQKSISHSE
jgi:hypothetical protein